MLTAQSQLHSSTLIKICIVKSRLSCSFPLFQLGCVDFHFLCKIDMRYKCFTIVKRTAAHQCSVFSSLIVFHFERRKRQPYVILYLYIGIHLKQHSFGTIKHTEADVLVQQVFNDMATHSMVIIRKRITASLVLSIAEKLPQVNLVFWGIIRARIFRGFGQIYGRLFHNYYTICKFLEYF